MIASVGADREGRSHNVNADEAAGAVARALGAYKVALPHRRRRLAAPTRPTRTSLVSETTADVVEAALDGDRRRHAARSSQACLDAIHGGVSTAHIVDGRVPHSLLLELFTDAGQGTKIWPAGRASRQLRALPGRVRARRTAARWSTREGNEYLDLLAGIAVCNTGHCHPHVVAAIREQAGRLMHVSNLFYTHENVRLAERLSAASLGGKVFFCNSGRGGQRGGDQARAQAPPRRRLPRRPRRLPRPHLRRAVAPPRRRPSRRRSRRSSPASTALRRRPRSPARSTEETAAVLLEVVQGESGVNLVRTTSPRARSARPATRTARC